APRPHNKHLPPNRNHTRRPKNTLNTNRKPTRSRKKKVKQNRKASRSRKQRGETIQYPQRNPIVKLNSRTLGKVCPPILMIRRMRKSDRNPELS
ncbi:MAG: hypothetical protein K2P44_05440, partial [Lachnospiraceae bacterium]|nr:hypothetical protein [Lachnospiraceae bacterium]